MLHIWYSWSLWIKSTFFTGKTFVRISICRIHRNCKVVKLNIQSRVAACNLNYLFQFYLKQCFQLYSASSLQVVLFHIFSYCTVSWYFLKLSVSTNSNKFIALSMLSLSSSRYWFSSTSLYCCELMCCLLSKHLIEKLYAYLKAFRSTQVSFVVFLSFSQNFLLNKKNIWIYSFIYCVLAVW